MLISHPNELIDVTQALDYYQDMPTLLRQNGFEFRVMTNDHEPAHIHVFLRDGEAKINILTAEVIGVWNMRPGDVRRAEEIVRENREAFLAGWRQIHG